MAEVTSKVDLLLELAGAYEHVIDTAVETARRGDAATGDAWGPREVVAHLAGWEVMATVRIPHIAAGMAPLEEADDARQAVMTDAINATIVTMAGDQPLDALCNMLRQAYQRDVALLRSLDDRLFQPGEYVYERTRAAIEHCHEHIERLIASHPHPDLGESC